MLNATRIAVATLAILAAPLALAHPATEWSDPTQVEVGAAKSSAPREKRATPRSVEATKKDNAKQDRSKAPAEPVRAAASR